MSQHDIGDVCATVKDGIDELTDATLDEIRRQVPAYRRVPLEEHRRAVRDQHEMRLGVLVTDRPLTPGDLKSAAHLARRRASQGIPIEDLISAYHLGDQELWQRILRVTAPRPSTSPLLATRMLASIHAISQVLAAAHAEVSRAQDEHRVTTSQRLVELLCAAPEPTPEALVLASSLG